MQNIFSNKQKVISKKQIFEDLPFLHFTFYILLQPEVA